MSKTTPLLAEGAPSIDAAVEAGLLPDVVMVDHARIAVKGAAPLGAFGMNLITVLYILGGFLAIYAALLFSSLVVDSFGQKGLLGLAIFYAVVTFGLAVYLQTVALVIPACVFAMVSMVMVPVAVYSICAIAGHKAENEPAVRSLVYLSCIAMGVLVLSTFTYPFMVVPLIAAICGFAVDIIPDVCKDVIPNPDKAHFYSWIFLVLGLVFLAGGFLANLFLGNLKGAADFAFWLFLTGAAAFEGGLFDLTFQGGFKELVGEHWVNAFKVLSLVINVVIMVIGAGMGRHVLTVMAGLGAFAGVTDLIYANLSHKWAHASIVALAGILLIATGILLARSAEIAAFLEFILPSAAVLAASFTLVATVAAVAGALYLFYLKRFKPTELTE